MIPVGDNGRHYFAGMRLYDAEGKIIYENTRNPKLIDGKGKEQSYWKDYELDPDEYLVGFHGQYNTFSNYIVKFGLKTVRDFSPKPNPKVIKVEASKPKVKLAYHVRSAPKVKNHLV